MINKLLTNLGARVIGYFEVVGGLVLLLKAALKQFSKKGVRCRLLLNQMAHLGVDTLPIVTLTMLFTGMVITLQTATEFIRLGAQSTVGGIVTIAIGRELGPVLAGVVMAGRVGSAITAEISTMKVTEQIDALRVMATNPVGYLVVPRIIAAMLMLPVLIVYADVVGVFGGWVVAGQYGINWDMYTNSITSLVGIHDILGGVYKGFVFGTIIALVGCFYGMEAEDGAEGVGKATTKSVVVSIVLIFFSNCLLSLLLYK